MCQQLIIILAYHSLNLNIFNHKAPHCNVESIIFIFQIYNHKKYNCKIKMSQNQVFGYIIFEVIALNIFYLVNLYTLDNKTQFPCKQYVIDPPPFQKMTPSSWISTQKFLVLASLIIFIISLIVCMLIKKFKDLNHSWHFCFVALSYEIALKIYLLVWSFVGMDIKQKWCEIGCVSKVCLDLSIDLNFHLYLIVACSFTGLILGFILISFMVKEYKESSYYSF